MFKSFQLKLLFYSMHALGLITLTALAFAIHHRIEAHQDLNFISSYLSVTCLSIQVVLIFIFVTQIYKSHLSCLFDM